MGKYLIFVPISLMFLASIVIFAKSENPIEQIQKELDAYDAGMNDWMSECAGLNRAVDDCSKAYDENYSLRRVYMLKHKDGK